MPTPISLPKSILDTVASWGLKRETEPLAQQFATPMPSETPAAEPFVSSIPDSGSLIPEGWRPAQPIAPQSTAAPVDAGGGFLSSIPHLDSLIPAGWRPAPPAASAPAPVGTAPQAASGVPAAMPTASGQAVSDGSPPGPITGDDRRARISSALAHARAAEAATGVPAEVNLAFAVHESGLEDRYGPGQSYHGRHATGDEPGTPINDWGYDAQGNRVDYPTKLKSYTDPGGSFHDFADLIANSPRYRPALDQYRQTGDKAQLVRDIWSAGYGESKTGPDETVSILEQQVAPIAGRAQAPQMASGSAGEDQPSGAYTQQALADAGDPDAWSKCGPVAAFQAAKVLGRAPTPQEVERLAKQYGWTAEKGMAGLSSEASVLEGMGIAAKAGGVDWQRVVADIQRGNPVLLQLPGNGGHYLTAQGYDPQTGRIDFGSTVGDLRAAGHRTQFTPDELDGLGWGSPDAALYIDNPASPAPSVVAGRVSLNAGAASPPAPAAGASGPPTAGTGAPDAMMLRQPLGPEDDPGTAGQDDPGVTRQRRFIPGPPEHVALGPALRGEPGRLEDQQYGVANGQARSLDDLDSPIVIDNAPARQYLPPGTRNRPVAGAAPREVYTRVPPELGPFDPTDRNRAVPDYDTTQTPLPGEGEGRYPNLIRDQLAYRQPLDDQQQPTSTYNDPTDGGTINQPLPPQPYTSTPDGQVAVPPDWSPPPEQPYTYAGDVPAPLAGDDPGQTQTARPVAQVVHQGFPTPPMPDLTPVMDAGGKVLAWIKNTAQGAVDQIGANVAENRRVAEAANTGQGGVNFGEGIKPAYDAISPYIQPMGGAPEIMAAIQDLNDLAAREQGRTDIRARFDAASDPAWRAANPVLADQYDQLQSQFALTVAGQVGDTPRAPRAPHPAATAAPVASNAERVAADARMAAEGSTSTLGTLGAGPGKPNLAASAEQIAAEQARGAVRGERLNAPLTPRQSALPLGLRAVVKATDDRAGLRWAEDMLSDAAGEPRMRENDVARPSTQSRLNAGSIADERITGELEPAVQTAAQNGLHNELPGYLQDMHARDHLDEVYRQAREQSLAEQGVVVDRHGRALEQARGTQERAATRATEVADARIARAEDALTVAQDAASTAQTPAQQTRAARRVERAQANLETARADRQTTIDNARSAHDERIGGIEGQRASAQAAIERNADRAGETALRREQAKGPDGTYEAIDARIKGTEARLEADGRLPALQEAAQGVWEHNRETLRRLRDAGRITQEELDRLDAAYPHYVPTRQVSRLDPAGGDPGSFLAPPTLQGEQLNPIVASRNLTLQGEREIQRNQVFTSFKKMFDDAVQAGGITLSPNGPRRLWEGDKAVTGWIDGKQTTIHVPAPVADGLNAAANMGTGDAVMGFWKKIASAVTSNITAARASFLPVNLMRDAQDYTIRTLAQEGGSPHRLPAVVGTWLGEAGNAVADIAASNANVRGAVGAAAGFGAGAAQGDENTTVGERVRHGLEGAVAGTFLLGANKSRVTGATREFLARGGGSGPINPGWRAGERWYRDVIRDGGAAIKTPADMGNFLRDWGQDILSLRGVKGINERTETISRAAAMRRAEGVRKLPAAEAMIAGRDASVDFDRAGTVIRAANGVVPFLNATTQAIAQTARLFRDHPIAATATVVSTLAPPMLLAEAYNRSDPERARAYDDVPQHLKDTGLVIMLPWSGSDNRGERPNYLWLPTGIQTPFVGAMREAMTRIPGLEPTAGAVGDSPEASDVERWANRFADIAQSFSPIRGDSASSLASNVIPPVAKQLVELGQNKDLYRGGQIMSPSSDERASSFSKTVAEGANAVGRAVGNDWLQEVRPSGVEYGVRTLPAYGDIVTGASDAIAPTGYKQAEDRPVQNEPFMGGIAGRFIRDTGGANSQRAQNERLPDSVRAAFEEAGMRPSAMLPVSSQWKNGPLTRDEQLRWQDAMNTTVVQEISAVRRDPKWRTPDTREQAVHDAMSRARQTAAERAHLPSDAIMQQRIRRDQAMKAR